jgi:hypothetical protein
MDNSFDGFITRLDMDEERITELDDMSTETSKLKCKQEKVKKIITI